MAQIYAELEVSNAGDLALARREFINPQEVRHAVVNAFVDSDAYMMMIPEHVRLRLGLTMRAMDVVGHSPTQTLTVNSEPSSMPRMIVK